MHSLVSISKIFSFCIPKVRLIEVGRNDLELDDESALCGDHSCLYEVP